LPSPARAVVLGYDWESRAKLDFFAVLYQA
jgi:hypothetical protein